jgi:signal transduction histidine kinase
MSSMKNESPTFGKRIFTYGILLLLLLIVIDRILLNSKLEEEKSQKILQVLQGNRVLSNELHAVFDSVQDDFNFVEKKILQLMKLNENEKDYQTRVHVLIEFLETHPGYFKVRLTDPQGQELFKIAQKSNHTGFYKSNELYNLGDQAFFQNLNKVQGKDFYFSSMGPNIINGVIEQPMRPTVRVAKRVEYDEGKFGLLIFNIDGEKILELFTHTDQNVIPSEEKILVDAEGFYVAAFPRLNFEDHMLKRPSLKNHSQHIFESLYNQKEMQGALRLPGEIIVYTQLLLPLTKERWFLLSKIPDVSWNEVIYKERLTWIFWEGLCFVIIMSWIWMDEKKRHKDEVVQVLLKERNEFIQNVSHQLKTPLAILINSLEQKSPTNDDWRDLKKEMHHLTKVVEDMLMLAQVDAYSNLPLKREDILEVVSSAVEVTGKKAKEKGIIIRFNVDEAQHRFEQEVMGDLLKSAIVNLIDNAIDFSPMGETVEVFVGLKDSKILIQVKDHGPGISEDFIPKLFLRFSRGDKGERKGSGLGLSIAKKIIDLHHGQIKLTEYKSGTTFEITL